MRRTRMQSVMKGAARLLDIGSTQNRRRIKKTVAEEVREVLINSNRMVFSVLYMNINKNIEEFQNTKTGSGAGKRLKAIESRIAGIEKKIKKYKEEAACQMERF